MSDALPIVPEKLLEETRWLQSLARCLAGPVEGDDLAQTAWLKALEQPRDRVRGLRPWLRTVLLNAFRRGRRDDGARRRRETAASRPEALPSAAELAARTSLHRAVADAVLALDEPARSTVILRFFEDRKPQEIARLQDIAVATVHTRLRRALTILRARLDRELGNRDSWVALAAPIGTGVAHGVATSVVASTAAKGTILGGLVMSGTTKATLGAACALLLAVGVVITWKAADPPPVVPAAAPIEDEKPAPPTSDSPAPVQKITPRNSAAEVEPATAPVPATAPAASPRPDLKPKARGLGALEGQILLDPFVLPSMVGVEVGQVAGSLAGHPAAVRLEREGRFRWDLLSGEPLRVTVSAAGLDEPIADVHPIAVRVGEVTRDPRLDPLDLRGRLRLCTITVVDGDDRPVSGAIVYVEPKETSRTEYGVTTKNDGTAPLLMTENAVDLRVEATGFRTTKVPGVAGDARVVVRRGPRIVFRFDRDPPALPRGTTPEVKLLRIAARASNEEDGPDVIRRFVDAQGRMTRTQQGGRNTLNRVIAQLPLDEKWTSAEVAIPEAGTFEVQLSLRRKMGNDGSSGALSVEYPPMPRIVVEDHDRLQQISCPAPPDAAVKKTLKQLDESIRK